MMLNDDHESEGIAVYNCRHDNHLAAENDHKRIDYVLLFTCVPVLVMKFQVVLPIEGIHIWCMITNPSRRQTRSQKER
jgi:hypothetical protein